MRPVTIPQSTIVYNNDGNVVSVTQNYLAPVASSANNITLSGGPYTTVPLNGSAVTAGVAVLDVQRPLAIASAGNDSAVTFTIKGTRQDGAPITELLAGANIGTATTLNAFKTVTSIVASPATASTITVGTSTTAWTLPVAVPISGYTNCTLSVAVTGTVSYSVQQTFDNPFVPNPDTQCRWSAVVAGLTSQTATASAIATQTAYAYRLLINSNTPPGGAQLEVLASASAIGL